MILQRASEQDAQRLTEISRRAFHSDASCGTPSVVGGPPGYDSPEWQKQVIRSSAAYYKIIWQADGPIIGGVILFDKGGGHYYLARIFLEPVYHRRGVGMASVRLLFAHYPDATKWTSETPSWNTRTRPFYEKLGFEIVREADGFLFFEKSLD